MGGSQTLSSPLSEDDLNRSWGPTSLILDDDGPDEEPLIPSEEAIKNFLAKERKARKLQNKNKLQGVMKRYLVGKTSSTSNRSLDIEKTSNLLLNIKGKITVQQIRDNSCYNT